MWNILKTFVALHKLLFLLAYAQNPSPCPTIFEYETGVKEVDRWYGTINLSSPDDLEGVWIKIILDTPADLLGNWVGTTVSSNNWEFKIRSPKFILKGGTKQRVRIFVKYNTGSIIPSLKGIRLNGKLICGLGTAPKNMLTEALAVSDPPSATTPSTRVTTAQTGNVLPAEETAEADYFEGDLISPDSVFAIPNKRKPTSIFKRSIACGTVAAQPTPLISNGFQTTPGQWPWHVAIFRDTMYICGGTLISEDYILTAAHCVTKPHTANPINHRRLRIFLGKYRLSYTEPDTQDIKVQQFVIHPEFSPSKYHNDIALVRLATKAQFTSTVRPACLWEDNEQTSNNNGAVIGWGFNERHQLSDILIQATMPIIPPLTCLDSHNDFYAQFLTAKKYCAGYKNGTEVCSGDSGSGMFFQKRSDPSIWQLRGLVSITMAFQGVNLCGSSKYTLFTDVGKHVDWIKNIINN